MSTAGHVSAYGMPDQSCVLSSAYVRHPPPRDWGVRLGRVGHMPSIPGKKPLLAYRFSREQRCALKKLADAPRGLTAHLLVVAHGYSTEMLSGLVLAGLAAVVTETTRARRGVALEVERICITEAGRRALEG